jgi:hypothetical protein
MDVRPVQSPRAGKVVTMCKLVRWSPQIVFVAGYKSECFQFFRVLMALTVPRAIP